MRTKLLFCAVIGLVCFIGVPVLAQSTDVDYACKTQPYHHGDENGGMVYKNLQDFLESFCVVEKVNSSGSQFEVIKLGCENVYEWTVEFALVPERVSTEVNSVVTGTGAVETYETYDIKFAQFWANLAYDGPSDDALPSWLKARTNSMFIIIKNDRSGTISKEQAEALLESIKTKKPVRIKGRLPMRPEGSTFDEVAERLGKRYMRLLEVGGVPVLDK